MAINLLPPNFLPPVAGVRLGCTRAFSNREDLTAMEIAPGSTVAGMFTRNSFAAAPVQICRKNINESGGDIRGLIINAGIANAGTSVRGLQDAEKSCQLLADMLGCRAENILPFSTGTIGKYIPMKQFERGLKKCAANLAADNWLSASRAIITGDSVAKGAFQIVNCGEKVFTVTGIVKGSSMIHPRMATMLAFIATDAAIPYRQLALWQRIATAKTFNAISVDGETSTNDSFALIATGQAGRCPDRTAGKIKKAIVEVCEQLAEAIVRDGEGANKFAVIIAHGARTQAACREVATTIAKSPLVRMAIAAGKADAGRLFAAAGNSGHCTQNMSIKIGDVYVIRNGGVTSLHAQARADSVLAGDEATITIELGDSPHSWTIKTCGMTRRYVDKFGL